jgi:hypothetical protein
MERRKAAVFRYVALYMCPERINAGTGPDVRIVQIGRSDWSRNACEFLNLFA